MSTISTVSILGAVTKKTDARTGFDIPMDVVIEVESDMGAQTPRIGAGDTWSATPPVGAEVDFIVVVTPRPLILNLVTEDATITDLPVRGIFILQTRGISSVSLENQNTVPVVATVALVREEPSSDA